MKNRQQILTRAQIKALLAEAKDDALLHPLLVTAVYTGMRLGDICTLRWSAVDFEQGTIAVPTTTPRRTVALTLFPALRTVLEAQRDGAAGKAPRPKPRGYVFPDAARRYTFTNEQGHHTLRGALLLGAKIHLARVLAPPPPDTKTRATPSDDLPDTATVEQRVKAARFTAKKTARIVQTYTLFRQGLSYSQISAQVGCRKGQCSEDLHALETLLGRPLRPGATSATTRGDLVRATRDGGSGWRSFRPVFCQMALDSGVPTATIEQIVGRDILARTLRRWHDTADLAALDDLATRALSLARGAITSRQTALVNAVLHAAGVETEESAPDPKRALALLSSAVLDRTRTRIAAALRTLRG